MARWRGWRRWKELLRRNKAAGRPSNSQASAQQKPAPALLTHTPIHPSKDEEEEEEEEVVAPPEPVPWGNLPDELLAKVFQALPADEAVAQRRGLERVCRQWRDVSRATPWLLGLDLQPVGFYFQHHYFAEACQDLEKWRDERKHPQLLRLHLSCCLITAQGPDGRATRLSEYVLDDTARSLAELQWLGRIMVDWETVASLRMEGAPWGTPPRRALPKSCYECPGGIVVGFKDGRWRGLHFWND